MAAPSRNPGLRERFRARAREEVLDAAVRVFVREGVAEARIDTVAAEAGVSVGTVYNLFGDRAGLVAATMERGREEIFADVRTYIHGSGDVGFVERLHGFVRLLLGHMRSHWPLLRAMADAEGRAGCGRRPPEAPPAGALREVYELVRGLILQGIYEGKHAAVDEHVATCALLGTMRETIFLDLLLGLDAPDEARADAIVKLYLEGAARRP